jgi:hypothetical protein
MQPANRVTVAARAAITRMTEAQADRAADRVDARGLSDAQVRRAADNISAKGSDAALQWMTYGMVAAVIADDDWDAAVPIMEHVSDYRDIASTQQLAQFLAFDVGYEVV